MKPRDYQLFAVDALMHWFSEVQDPERNPLIAMPTGTGKSLVIAEFLRRTYATWPRSRVWMLTHVKELVSQNADKLLRMWPTAPLGILSAGLGRYDESQPILFAGIATLAGRLDDLPTPDLILIDEAHMLSPKESSRYQVVIAKVRDKNPHVRVIGLSATIFRMSRGMLTEPIRVKNEAGVYVDKYDVFTDVCVDMTQLDVYNWFFEQGYLTRLVPKRTNFELDVSDVAVQGDDYNQKQLQECVDKEEITRAALKEAVAVSEDRYRWLVFASGIEHAMHVAEVLNEMGVTARAVHSKMKDTDRDATLADHQAGRFVALVNNGILTTGYDDPHIDNILVLRPTKSSSLWVQILGRGTRPLYAEGYDLSTVEGRLAAIANGGKPNTQVLDFAANTRRLGPINDPVLPRPKGEKGKGPKVAPIRICEVCNTYNHASVRVCLNCGHEFPRSNQHTHRAATDELIATKRNEPIMPVLEEFKVDRVTYNVKEKPGRPDCLQVNYYCGLRWFKEYVHFEVPGFPYRRAASWWLGRGGRTAVPSTATEAQSRLQELSIPKTITVAVNSRYQEVTAYGFL
ncbi:ResIII [Microcystis phage Me-ZS1]|nr:ResIII [Microcystis phage Me-ZS1]